MIRFLINRTKVLHIANFKTVEEFADQNSGHRSGQEAALILRKPKVGNVYFFAGHSIFLSGRCWENITGRPFSLWANRSPHRSVMRHG